MEHASDVTYWTVLCLLVITKTGDWSEIICRMEHASDVTYWTVLCLLIITKTGDWSKIIC